MDHLQFCVGKLDISEAFDTISHAVSCVLSLNPWTEQRGASLAVLSDRRTCQVELL